jgi:hypothetical protein
MLSESLSIRRLVMAMQMATLIANIAGCNNVGCDVLSTILPGNEVLCS